MDGVAEDCRSGELLMLAARELKGFQRRVFLGRVCRELCDESPRKAEARFGWGRETVAKGLRELKSQKPELNDASNSVRGRPRMEHKNPQLAVDIRLIVEPHTHSDPELKTSRQYTNLSAEEVHEALLAKGYDAAQLPSERTIRDILNRMNYRLKRIQKGKPLKKTKDTSAIFENVKAARTKYSDDQETLEISVDTKAKVSLGEYALGGKNTDRQRRQSHQRVGS
jgi:predicted acyl esterase